MTARLDGKRDRTYTKVVMSVTAARRVKSAYGFLGMSATMRAKKDRQLGAKNDDIYLNWRQWNG